MNKIILLTLLFVLTPYRGYCGPVFSSMVKGAGNDIFVALKDESGKNPSPNIVTINKESLEIKAIELSQDIKSRDVIALHYFKNMLLILSQWTIEDNDKPMLHTYDIRRKKWENLGRFKCPDFESFAVGNELAQLFCTGGSIDSIKVPKMKISKKQTIVLPQKKIALNDKDSIWFQGFPYLWKALHIKKNKKTHVLDSLKFYKK